MSLQLQSNAAPAKITVNTTKVSQGLSINLSKENPSLRQVAVKVKWEGGDLDISAVGLGKDGTALINVVEVFYNKEYHNIPKDWIYYMNLERDGIKHGGDLVSSGKEEEEQMLVSAGDLDKGIHALDFLVTSHVKFGKALLFKDVTNMSAELIDLDTNEVIYQTDLDSRDLANQSGAVFATLAKDENGDWSYSTKMVGIGNETEGAQNTINYYFS